LTSLRAGRTLKSLTSSCFDTGYTLDLRPAHESPQLYDCSFADGSEKCVVRLNGVTEDETSLAKALFKQSLGTTTPTCAE
jgi:hypothetical protein